MFKLKKVQPITTVKEPGLIVTSATNYTKDQINSLFELEWYQPVYFYKPEAKKLFDLGLSFEDSKYLLQTKKLSVDEIVKCISDFNLDVDLIKKLACTKEDLLDRTPDLISKVGGIENLRTLNAKGLSIENIEVLFKQLRLSYKETISLVSNCGYSVYEIRRLVEGGFSSSQLIALANVLGATEAYSLFNENKQNLVLLSTVSDILNRNISNLDSTTATVYYQTLYESIPVSLCQSLIRVSRLLPPVRRPDPDLTYEDILIYYMNLAGGSISITAEALDAIPILFKSIEKIVKFFKQSNFEIFDNYIPVKPFILAAIWCSLDISLEIQYLKNTEHKNMEVVGRSVLAFMLSSMCGITGYFHSGGIGLPFPNITSYIKTYFNVQHKIKNSAPKIYNKIPQCLLFASNQDFDNLIREKQISAGQGLSMVYTFRVGNAFLCALLETNIFTLETAKNIFKSLWPLPQEAESTRMYFIYSGLPIYSQLNLKDVFVSIN